MKANPNIILKLLTSGAGAQLTTGLVGLLRIPAIVTMLGSAEFGRYAASMGLWSFFSIAGEVSRQRIRQASATNALTKSLLKATIIRNLLLGFSLVAAALFVILILAGFSIDFPANISIFLLVAILSLAYVPSAAAVGVAEGRLGFASVSNVTSITQILSLPLTWAGCYLESPLLVAVSALLPFLAPGFYQIGKNILKDLPSVPKEAEIKIGLNYKFMVIIVADTVVYALDTIIVLSIGGPIQAAQHALMQRIGVIFSMLPTLLGPFVAVLHSLPEPEKAFKRIRFLVLGAGIIASTALYFAAPVFSQLLSGGQIEIPQSLLVCCILYGLAFSFCNPFVNAATNGRKFSARFQMAPVFAATSIALDVLLVPLFGAAGAFAASLVGLLVYTGGISIFGRAKIVDKGANLEELSI
jgi:hypothetical protein